MAPSRIWGESFANPSIVLQWWQSNPRTIPVSWSWSTNSLFSSWHILHFLFCFVSIAEYSSGVMPYLPRFQYLCFSLWPGLAFLNWYLQGSHWFLFPSLAVGWFPNLDSSFDSWQRIHVFIYLLYTPFYTPFIFLDRNLGRTDQTKKAAFADLIKIW